MSDAACSSRRDLVGVAKDERCFLLDLSTRFETEKLAFRVLFDLNMTVDGSRWLSDERESF